MTNSEHARLGMSNKRWPICPGSVREEANYPDIPGEAAISGTGSHLLLEMCLVNHCRADAFLGGIIGENHEDSPNGWLVKQDRVDRVQMCLDYVERRKAELMALFPGSMVNVEAESRSYPGAWFSRDDWWGTCDITIICFSQGVVHFVEVCDYKDGRGYVDAQDNSQLQGYLWGKIITMPSRPWHFRMTIVQPKTKVPVRYVCSMDDQTELHKTLSRKMELLADAAAATDDPAAPVTPGEHCRWCKANPRNGGHCTAPATKSMEVIAMTTNDSGLSGQLLQIVEALINPGELDNEMIVGLADCKEPLMSAFAGLEAEITRRITAGDPVSGYALVPGRVSKSWALSEDEIVKKLKGRRLNKEDVYPKKLITVAQLMKLEKLTDEQKSKIVAEMVTEKAGAKQLRRVVADDRPTVSQMFGEAPAAPAAQPLSFL